ncbi:HD-GYP domain-containing protein [Athalassotoga saccharophila]|uniref:HD-GYP domain-containing protein n=1 Tax=Athalassotoga saccharophila TaxID=1441386 RepID=UPI00137B714D|nr:HD-GYP domain-containing protein [Athalassotoga saccharophila]BBJ27417.1 cyclic di-GMP phosphodiesterase [Athalassotoga saccharophila]
MDKLIFLYIVVALLVIVLILYLRNVQSSLKKISQLRDERERLTKENSDLKKKLSEISSISHNCENSIENFKNVISNLEIVSQKNYSEFFEGILDLAISCIPEAKAGSISIIDGRKWKYMAIRGSGKNLEKLKSLDLKSEWMILTPKVSVIEDIAKANEKNVPREYSKIIEEVVGGHIYRSLVLPLKNGGDLVGNCFLDALEDIQFSRNSHSMAEILSNLFSTMITLKSLATLPEVSINNSLRTIVNFYEMKNSGTRGHSENVAHLAVRIGERMNLSPQQIGDLYWAGIFHDIGLIAVPDEILEKPGKLTDQEFEVMKSHTLIGEKMLQIYDHLKEMGLVARTHHENFDGSGYPENLKGGSIPLLSRIISLADAFDTMRRPKNYGEGLSTEEAIKQIEADTPSKYDPEISRIAVEVFKSISTSTR